jgi:hypothetical protein
LTSICAKAGNEKFAGEDKNTVGTELLKLPVAAASGVFGSIVKLGTRGMSSKRRIPALKDESRR